LALSTTTMVPSSRYATPWLYSLPSLLLNTTELANSLKPIVLPARSCGVHHKEGKEYNQGVAYLDDGTMVVVDNAKKMISKTIDIAVTSVIQTTAGKMIFRQVR